MPRKKTDSTLPAPLPPAMPDRRLMEQQLAQVSRLLEARNFATIEEANAFLQEIVAGGQLAPPEPETPLEEAQQMVYQALEATGRRRATLAKKALAISPDCADAYVILGEAARTPQEAKSQYEAGVEAGIRALGPDVFAEEVGYFWDFIETRGYMRALEGLAFAEWELGERDEAIGNAREMLRLNPTDNQGIRYILVNWLLAMGDDDAVGALLKQYAKDRSAHWTYTKALWAFRTKGKGAAATRALKAAFAANPFVPMYLFGVWEMPDELPDYMGMGDENEAIAYVDESFENWNETPGALEWFGGVMERMASQFAKEQSPPAPRPSIQRPRRG